MLFNTVTYAYFFAGVFILTWLLSPWRRARLFVLLLSSYVFYAGWTFVGVQALKDSFGTADFWPQVYESIKYCPLIFIGTSIDYYLGIFLDRLDNQKHRRWMLIGTIALNVGILVYFKYWNWGAETFQWVMQAGFDKDIGNITHKVDLPIGISFFCFMSLSYVIDVYRRDIPACRSYLNYLTYISFFPHLVAGPIVRGRDLLPHLERDTRVTPSTGGEGMFLIASGLLKKVVIGDYIAVNFVDRVFAEPTSYSSIEVMAAMYGYAVQVYCDFSGYSDVAIGSALLLGYRFKINFDQPFKSTNIVEFWRRWHISLSTWLRDYIYIPMGGSRKGKPRQYFNMFMTMLLCGVWHGAAWTYFIFGCIQGTALSVTHWFQTLRDNEHRKQQLAALAGISGLVWLLIRAAAIKLERPGASFLMGALILGGWLIGIILWFLGPKKGEQASFGARLIAVAANFTFVGVTFTMFRAASLDKAWSMYERLLTFTTFTPNLNPIVMGIIFGALVLQWSPRKIYDHIRELFIRAPALIQAVVLLGVAFILRLASTAEAVPFVYFSF